MRFYLLLGGLLWAASAWAQQPALPGAPQPPAAPAAGPGTTPADYVPGRRYEVTLRGGSVLEGVLTTLSLENLEFETKDLGRVVVPRANLLQARSLDGPAQLGLRPGYYDIGNGTRYFFGPSGRNLRKGEGVVQDVWLFLAGVNYGITDNFSVGGYLSLVPGVGLQNQFLLLTPKVAVPVGNKWSLGAGALYVRVPGFDDGYTDAYGVGLLYGVATHGTADHNFSVGIGYGFAGSDIGSTPTIYLAGQTRVSRRISLLSENYIVAASDGQAIFGIYGLKISWLRTSLGLASGYAGYIDNRSSPYSDRSFFIPAYVYPVYMDFSFRFGRPSQAAAR